MARYIDADKLKTELKVSGIVDFYGAQIIHKIDNMKPADVQEVKHGKWIKEWRDGFVDGKRNYVLICPYCNFSYLDNQCGFIVPEHFNFCPNCGAKMDGDKELNKTMSWTNTEYELAEIADALELEKLTNERNEKDG